PRQRRALPAIAFSQTSSLHPPVVTLFSTASSVTVKHQFQPTTTTTNTRNMAPTTVNILPLLALLLTPATHAFVAPANTRGVSLMATLQRPAAASTTTLSSARTAPLRSTSSAAVVRMAADTNAAAETPAAETTEQTVARLRETAAALRSQAVELESKREQERRAGADRSFNTFDSNNDGTVDVRELQAGLVKPLRRSFTKQLTARMGRKPSEEEVDARIAELPGGTLFPEDLARKLIAVYDQNSDGVLQQSEFAPTEELRMRLENMFREQREEERLVRVAEREREMAEKLAAEDGVSGDVVLRDVEVNNGEPTSTDRALSALAYLLPLVDGMSYAGHLFTSHPEQMAVLQPLAAVLLAVRSLPFAMLIGFFGLSSLSNNPQINKLVRFNMRQAINLDIALILPGIVGALASASLGNDAYKLAPLTNAGSDVVFVALLAAVAYSVGSSAFGEFPNKLPFFGRINRENPEQEEEL
ncbi:unnamed protein product, partial [Sphacelaria rigidula]